MTEKAVSPIVEAGAIYRFHSYYNMNSEITKYNNTLCLCISVFTNNGFVFAKVLLEDNNLLNVSDSELFPI